MKYLSVCSGIEAASVAWGSLGWQAVGFSEIEPFCCELLKQRFPDVANFGDMTSYKEWNIEKGTVELLVGGTPCQSFSISGLREGLTDDRGNLALTFCNIANHFKPRWILWENVPGVLSSNRGRDFGIFLGAMGQLGYGFAYRVLNAQFWGVAQRRSRVFVVGYLGDWRPPAAVLFDSESLQRNVKKTKRKKHKSSESGEKGTKEPVALSGLQMFLGVGRNIAPALKRKHQGLVAYSIAGNAINRSVEQGGNGRRVSDDVCYTLTSTDRHAVVANYRVRFYTPLECERLQGFPDNWTKVIYNGKSAKDTPRYRAIGNSMPVPVMTWLGERIEYVERLMKEIKKGD